MTQPEDVPYVRLRDRREPGQHVTRRTPQPDGSTVVREFGVGASLEEVEPIEYLEP